MEQQKTIEDVMISPETVENAVVKMNVTEQAIADLKAQFGSLKIAGLEDKEGYKLVYEARQTVKKIRVEAEKYGKSLRDGANAWIKKVSGAEKNVVNPLKELETYLQAEQDKIDAEKERIKKEKAEAEEKKMQSRIDALAQYGLKTDLTYIKVLTDDQFEKVVSNARDQWEIEQAKLKEQAEKDAADRAELEELRKQKAENDRKESERVRLEQQAAEDKRRLEEQEAALKKQQADAEEAQKAAVAKALEDAENKRKADVAAALAAEQAEKAAQERAAALAPDKEKLMKLVNDLSMINYPEVTDAGAMEQVTEARQRVASIQKNLIKFVKSND